MTNMKKRAKMDGFVTNGCINRLLSTYVDGSKDLGVKIELGIKSEKSKNKKMALMAENGQP